MVFSLRSKASLHKNIKSRTTTVKLDYGQRKITDFFTVFLIYDKFPLNNKINETYGYFTVSEYI